MGILSGAKFYFKSVVFGLLISVCALYGVIASLVLRILGKEEYAQYTVARAFYYLCKAVLGIDIIIKNAERLQQKPAVVISNHQAAIDVLVLGKLFQPGYTVTAKRALKFVPFLGWFMLALSTFFLDRARGEKARKVLDNALLKLKQHKRLIFMFPEGTRSATRKLEMLPFKKGAFHLAQKAQIPVIPVVVSNYSTIFSSRNKVFNRGKIVLEVLEARSTEGLTSEQVSDFANKIREDMLEKVEAMGYAKTSLALQEPQEPQETQESEEVEGDDVSVEIVSEATPLIK